MRCVCWSIIFFFLLFLFFTHYITAPPDESVGVSSFVRYLVYIFLQTVSKIGGSSGSKRSSSLADDYSDYEGYEQEDSKKSSFGATTTPSPPPSVPPSFPPRPYLIDPRFRKSAIAVMESTTVLRAKSNAETEQKVVDKVEAAVAGWAFPWKLFPTFVILPVRCIFWCMWDGCFLKKWITQKWQRQSTNWNCKFFHTRNLTTSLIK